MPAVDLPGLTDVLTPAHQPTDASEPQAFTAEAKSEDKRPPNGDPSAVPASKKTKKAKRVPAHLRRAAEARAEAGLPPNPETARPPAAHAPKPQAAAAPRKYDVPSKASGGVPEPTAAYLAQAAIPPSRLDSPRNILVVIDLNGTLLHRPNHKNPSRFVERPHTRAFLDYCIRTFTVAIWSSAKPDNVHKMLRQILSPEDRDRLVAVWGRDTLGLSPDDYNRRVQCYKRLAVLWRDLEKRLGQRWDQSNTLLVDDSKEKSRSEPFNLIQLPEFKGNLDEPGYVLPQVHDYINTCAQQRDISAFARLHPFNFQSDFDLNASVEAR